ncbi:MAG: hypothetical protein JWM80_5913 [Cyanobacteria bacterium RYN_339]|nr:hypothetical protein [Cyanobacteria bacterium RYN_339]
MQATAPANPILQSPRPFMEPGRQVSWRGLHVAVGQEMFGRRAGPWGIVFAPLPVAAVLLGLYTLLAPEALLGPWLTGRLAELAWVAWAPFVLAAAAQALMLYASDFVWKLSEGQRHLDYSPRAWHYHVGVAIALFPLVLLQCSDTCLDLYLRCSLMLNTAVGSPHAGYSPGLAHLLVLGALPAIHWQVRRVIVKIPCGRVWGLQRELARLRGSMAFQPDAWAQVVGEAFDRWLEDLAPPEIDVSGERARQHRLRWGGLRKELIEAWRETPPDLPRANRALSLYRNGW